MATKPSPNAQDNSAAAYASSSLNSLATRSDAARWRDELMDAIAAMPANFLAIRNMLSTIATREDLRKPVLLSASVSTRHKLRTPLMAAASTGEMAIVGKRARADTTTAQPSRSSILGVVLR